MGTANKKAHKHYLKTINLYVYKSQDRAFRAVQTNEAFDLLFFQLNRSTNSKSIRNMNRCTGYSSSLRRYENKKAQIEGEE